MSTVRRRRLAASALATTAVLALGGCGTGFSAQTNQVYQAGIGANHRGELDVLNTLLVANDDGSATLSTSIINNGSDEQELSSVKVTTLDGKPLEVRSTKMTLSLPVGRLTMVGRVADAGGFAVLDGATPGSYVRVTLTFTGRTEAESAAPVTIQAPVVTRTAEYDEVGGAPTVEATPTPEDTESTDDAESAE